MTLLEVQWTISWKISPADPESVCVGCQACGVGPGDSYLDQLLLAEPAANRALGSSRWVWLALHGREGSREGSLGYLRRGGKEEGREKRKAVCGGQANEWLWGREWGIRHMVARGLNFPAISMTPGLVLIGQDTSPNPSPVLLSVWSPPSSVRRWGEWTKARDEKGASLWGLIQLDNC